MQLSPTQFGFFWVDILQRRCSPRPKEGLSHVDFDEKHLVLCPFLQKRGYCLKGSRCDFSLSNSYSYSFPPSRPVNNFSTPSILHHYRPTPIPQDTSRGIGANSFPQSFFQIYPRPLMEILVHPPNPYAFRKHLCYRTPYVKTLV